jgi:autotransporter-associated beta strand protein
MKSRSLPVAVSLLLSLPAAADVIYSNLKDIAIPATFAGVYLDVETGNWNTDINAPQSGWDINPFFGGSAVWNSPEFQPVRATTSETSAVTNLAQGSIVSSGSTFSTFTWDHDNNVGTPQVPGYGSSETHLGTGAGQFEAGQEGYLGFRLNGSNYGWMRVVFTNNTGGALIKEWAYDSGGTSIAVANIKRTGADVVLDSANGNFAVGSVIADASGTTNVVKSGAGTTDLNGANTYTGTTTVTAGRLNVNGSTAAASTVTVNTGTTLGGDGVINGNVTLNGALRAGQGGSTDRSLEIAGTLTGNTGSSMVFTITSESSHDQLIVGSVDLTNINLVIESLSDTSFTILPSGDGANFLTNGASYYQLIDGTTTGMFANVTETMSPGELYNLGLTGTQYVTTWFDQRFWVAEGSTYLVAIPETSVTLLGSLSALLLLRRRR